MNLVNFEEYLIKTQLPKNTHSEIISPCGKQSLKEPCKFYMRLEIASNTMVAFEIFCLLTNMSLRSVGVEHCSLVIQGSGVQYPERQLEKVVYLDANSWTHTVSDGQADRGEVGLQ